MKLDKEEDRNMLLEIIAKAQVAGGAVFVVADLITRIRDAGLEDAAKHAEDGAKGKAKP